MWEKTTIVVVSVFKHININNFLHYCIHADTCQYASTHLLKATTFTHSPTPIGREIQSPDMITSYYWQEALTSSLKAPTLNNIRGPCFINFHTRSTYFNTSQLVDQMKKTPT